MDTKILKHLLSNEFYAANKYKLSPSLFEDEIQELYEVVAEAHDKYSKDIGGPDLLALWKIRNPVAVRAKIAVIEDIVNRIQSETLYADEVAGEIIAHLWQREHGRKIAEAGLAISEGRPEAFTRLQSLLDKTKDGFMPDDFGPETTKDLHTLLELTGDDNRWRFNILSLNRHVYGVGPGEFMIGFARPETGKTALGVSLSCAPGGFCEQGAKVFIGGNEEDTKRTMLRAYQAAAGMSREQISETPQPALEAFERISKNLVMRNIMDWSIWDLDAYLEKEKFDVAIIDQLDKIKLPGEDIEGHARLREIYLQAREIAKRRELAFIAICQASVEAQDKTILNPSMMEGSKTGKYAEADLIIGVGKGEDNSDGTPVIERYLNVGKNKLTGWHGTIVCRLDGPTSRYLD
jgi:hypothetical protein